MENGRLFSFQESVALFRKADEELTIGNSKITISPEEISTIRKDVQSVLDNLEKLKTDAGSVVQVAAVLGRLEGLTKQGEITQESINEVLVALKKAPVDTRNQISSFLTSLAASGTFQAISQVISMWK